MKASNFQYACMDSLTTYLTSKVTLNGKYVCVTSNSQYTCMHI